mmetsp:Transcript_18964/g.51388  ORF Transcript_18964/g.51388 Transcript_18964/m.51388 type:complete len:240 (-) Transcript_18964:50-769(-)
MRAGHASTRFLGILNRNHEGEHQLAQSRRAAPCLVPSVGQLTEKSSRLCSSPAVTWDSHLTFQQATTARRRATAAHAPGVPAMGKATAAAQQRSNGPRWGRQSAAREVALRLGLHLVLHEQLVVHHVRGAVVDDVARDDLHHLAVGKDVARAHARAVVGVEGSHGDRRLVDRADLLVDGSVDGHCRRLRHDGGDDRLDPLRPVVLDVHRARGFGEGLARDPRHTQQLEHLRVVLGTVGV